MHKLTTEQFKEKATKIHGDKFLYDKADYQGAHKKLILVCKIHGDFLITPDAHTHMKAGCAECKRNNISQKNRCLPEEFIPKAIAVHGDKYDYSQTVYTLSKDKLTIVCEHHGPFDITPNDHLRSNGCAKCAGYGYQVMKPGHFYVLRNENGLTKVGITNRVVQERVKKINRNTDLNFQQVLALRFENGADALDVETLVLATLRSQYKNPEQIYDGSTESFVDVDLPKLLQTISAL